MSSHSSDVYVMDDPAGSSAAPSTYTREGLVRSPSATSSEFSNAKYGRHCEPERIMRSVGNNTEENVSACVSALLWNSIIKLMQTVGGDEFAHYMSLGNCYKDPLRASTGNSSAAANRVMQHLREVIARHGKPPTMMKAVSQGVTSDDPTLPVWLEEMQLSLAKNESLLREIIETNEKQSATTDATQMTSPFSVVHQEAPADALYSLPTPEAPAEGDETGRIQKLKLKVRTLEEKMAETRVVLDKEGVDSVIPLYNELLSLREMKQQVAMRDAETTMAYLTTQDAYFKELLASVDRRKKVLDINLNRYCCEGGEEGVLATLTDDVERLAKLGRDLDIIRDEYQRSIVSFSTKQPTSLDSYPGEKRLRTSEGSLQTLLQRQLQADEELKALHRELDEEKRESAEWKRRYDMIFQSMHRPQDNEIFLSLLREVEARLSGESMSRSASLCRLFGWELVDISRNCVSIARFGFSEEQLTLPLPEMSSDQRSAIATSVVLAKKVLDGCAALCERQEVEKRTVVKDDEKDDEGKTRNALHAQEMQEKSATINASGEMHPAKVPECELYGASHDTVETNNDSTEVPLPPPLLEGVLSDANNVDSTERPEPSFYNSGLWDE